MNVIVRLFRGGAQARHIIPRKAAMALLQVLGLPALVGRRVGFVGEKDRFFFAEMFLTVFSDNKRLSYFVLVFILHILQ